MTPEEQKKIEEEAILGFLGSNYGELKKLDGHIVGSSSTLQPRSEDAKNALTAFVNEKRKEINPPPPSVVQQPQIEIEQPITPEQQIVMQPQIDNNQLSFNFDVNEKDELFTLLEKVLTRLDSLHRKIDKIVEVNNKNVAKKKSVKKEEK
jgi:hypothetical protein